jgi:hypothetical protein
LTQLLSRESLLHFAQPLLTASAYAVAGSFGLSGATQEAVQPHEKFAPELPASVDTRIHRLGGPSLQHADLAGSDAAAA